MNTHQTNTDNPIDFPSNSDWERFNKSFLIHAKGNLLDMAENGDFDIIIQGCNCFNTMGGGIAREISERYPEVSVADNKTEQGDYNKLGNWTSELVIRNNGTVNFTVINAYTQYNMSKGTDVFEYAAFELILQKICYKYGKLRIGLPYIGMGLAGGDKEVIMEQLEYFAAKVDERGGSVTLVEFS